MQIRTTATLFKMLDIVYNNYYSRWLPFQDIVLTLDHMGKGKEKLSEIINLNEPYHLIVPCFVLI